MWQGTHTLHKTTIVTIFLGNARARIRQSEGHSPTRCTKEGGLTVNINTFKTLLIDLQAKGIYPLMTRRATPSHRYYTSRPGTNEWNNGSNVHGKIRNHRTV